MVHKVRIEMRCIKDAFWMQSRYNYRCTTFEYILDVLLLHFDLVWDNIWIHLERISNTFWEDYG